MNYILITNYDGTGIDKIICDTELDNVDVWLFLVKSKHHFDEVKMLECMPSPIPDGTSLRWLTPRAEYEIRREIALQTPSLAPFFPPWEELHKKKRATRQ